MGRMKELAWELHQAGACDAPQCVFCNDNNEEEDTRVSDVAKLSDSSADIVIGKKFPDNVDSPLFLEGLLDKFFVELETAAHSPSINRQANILNTIQAIADAFEERLKLFSADAEASAESMRKQIARIGE